MYYSQRIGYVDVYEKDDFGNIKYTEIEEDGEIIQIPIPTGEKELTYGAAVPFRAIMLIIQIITHR